MINKLQKEVAASYHNKTKKPVLGLIFGNGSAGRESAADPSIPRCIFAGGEICAARKLAVSECNTALIPSKYSARDTLYFVIYCRRMIITYHGGQCFKASFGDTTIAFSPASKDSKNFNAPKFGADVALVSTKHPDFNGTENASHGARQPFVIDGPGEYEIGEVTVQGFGVPTIYDGKPGWNTIYQVQLEGINMLFLGALSDPEIDPKILGELGDIDVLFLPIGGGDVLEVPQASKLAVKLEAHVVIPMHYDAKALTAFLKEEGTENGKPQEKFTIKKKDVVAMEGEIVVLSDK